MPDDQTATYPSWIGFIYIFNLIVGTGALTLPGVFARTGWLLSLVSIILIAAISYMTATFIIEAMACANAVKHWRNLQVLNRNRRNINNDEEDEDDNIAYDGDNSQNEILERNSSNQQVDALGDQLERQPLYQQSTRSSFYYKLDEKFELVNMAEMFFNGTGRILFYVCVTVYLYGDLSIYSAAVSKTLRDLICDVNNNTDTYSSHNVFEVAHVIRADDLTTHCWKEHTMSRANVYRLLLIAFNVLLGPFVAFNVQKTQYLQILTVIFRWMAFGLMISLAIRILVSSGAAGHPPIANIYGLPAFFGACVYSFMCHHSLPNLLQPIRNKSSLQRILSIDYLLIVLFYIVLAMTAIFAFEHIEDLYSLNFAPSNEDNENKVLIVINYFLMLFPVFTLSTSFPIIGITQRNNLQTLFLNVTRLAESDCNYIAYRIMFPLFVILPPFLLTYFTENLTNLVAFTGCYAGVAVQYFIPIVLVYQARKTCGELFGNGVQNEFQSPFRSRCWLYVIFVWAFTCICLVTAHFVIDANAAQRNDSFYYNENL